MTALLSSFCSLPLQRQQADFLVHAPGVSRQASVCADHPMAWHDDGNRVSPDRAADSPRAHAVAQQRAVCRRLPVWNFKQARPHAQPERRADQVQRRGEIRLSARKVVVQPARRLVKNRRALFLARLRQIRREMPCAVKPEPDQPLLVGGEQKTAEGRGVTLRENQR